MILLLEANVSLVYSRLFSSKSIRNILLVVKGLLRKVTDSGILLTLPSPPGSWQAHWSSSLRPHSTGGWTVLKLELLRCDDADLLGDGAMFQWSALREKEITWFWSHETGFPFVNLWNDKASQLTAHQFAGWTATGSMPVPISCTCPVYASRCSLRTSLDRTTIIVSSTLFQCEDVFTTLRYCYVSSGLLRTVCLT